MVALLTLLVVGWSLSRSAEAASGDLDPTFGGTGRVVTDFLIPIPPDATASAYDGASAVAIQTDGKIVAAGFTLDANFAAILALARYNSADGSLDTSFGPDANGKVPIGMFFAGAGSMDFLPRVALAIQTDGKIVVVGMYADPVTFQSHFGLVRFNPNGTPDASFGSGGLVTTDLGGSAGARAVALQGDGKIVVAGWAGGDVALVRYNADGSLDTAGFGGGTGIVTADFAGQQDFANGVALQGDGRIVVVGAAQAKVADGDYRWYFAVSRYDPDGTLEAPFGTSGWVTIDFAPANLYEHWNQANAVVIQPTDGKIVAAGYTFVNNATQATYFDFALARLNPDGSLDPTFGGGTGLVMTDFPSGAGPGFDQANGVALQADGKIVAGGSRGDLSNVELVVDFSLARYNPDGTLDTTFGGGTGRVTTDFSLGVDGGQGVAIQADCKIVAAGYTWKLDGGTGLIDTDFAVARYDGGACAATSSPCPKSQGYWKTHPSIWPVTALSLGSQTYTQTELLALLNTAGPGDASVALARQLIAAKLNLANGSNPAPISSTVAAADALLGGFSGKLPYQVKPSSATGQLMAADAAVLDQYNQGLLTPECQP